MSCISTSLKLNPTSSGVSPLTISLTATVVRAKLRPISSGAMLYSVGASSTSTTFTGATSARQALNAACKAEPGILSYAGTGFEVGVSSSDLLNGNYILLLPFQYTVPQLPPP